MNTTAVSCDGLTDEQQTRLAELLERYFAAVERGQPVGRAQLIAAHPDLAAPLAEYLDSLDFLQDAAAGFRARPAPVELTGRGDADRKELGDFELLHEIGRGGMGVVYEARQMSLDRRVALKMLPFAALLDAKQIVRFRNEAQAAAQLHHPHIVPVYFVGTDRGVHFYAMQLIDGQPLDRAIGELRGEHPPAVSSNAAAARSCGGAAGEVPSAAARQPIAEDAAAIDSLAQQYSSSKSGYFRTIARLGIQAAEALHCAHEFGIVHRDIKPSNLLLDSSGKLWVTDFGLARFRHDAQLTGSHEFLGTIRYMSPEQARGELPLIDHRTDIYSLGVTLYELLALKHPVRARQPAAILMQLESEHPYRLRVLNPKIPADLENIIHKAISKSRDDRYSTALEFADDLRRFLDGLPTVAKRPTVAGRLIKWMRRHRVVASCLMVLVIAVLGLLATLGLFVNQQQATKLALSQYRAQLALSENHLGLLHNQSGDTQSARAAFREAIRLQRAILAEHPNQERALRELAASLINYSYFCSQHDPPEAEGCYDETLRLQQRLVAANPSCAQYRADLALTYSNFGSFCGQQGQPRRALTAYQSAVETLEHLDAAGQRFARDLAVIYNNLGMTQDTLGLVGESESAFTRALEVLGEAVQDSGPTPSDASRLGGIHNNLGMVFERQQRWQEAADSYANAIRHQRTAAGRAPQVARFRDLLAKHRDNHARVLQRQGS